VDRLLILQREQRQASLWLQFLFITHTLQKKRHRGSSYYLKEMDAQELYQPLKAEVIPHSLYVRTFLTVIINLLQ